MVMVKLKCCWPGLGPYRRRSGIWLTRGRSEGLTIDTVATYRPSESKESGTFTLCGTKGASRFSRSPVLAAATKCAPRSANTSDFDMLRWSGYGGQLCQEEGLGIARGGSDTGTKYIP